MPTSAMSDKDHTLISCRRVILRFLEPEFVLTETYRRYAISVLHEAYAVLDDVSKRVSDGECQ